MFTVFIFFVGRVSLSAFRGANGGRFSGLRALLIKLLPLGLLNVGCVSWGLGVTRSSFMLRCLSCVLLVFIYLELVLSLKFKVAEFSMLLGTLILFCLIVFFSVHMLSLFVFFEIALFPIFIIIIGWGYQPERVYAGYMLCFYGIIRSAPALYWLLKFNTSCSVVLSLNYYMSLSIFSGNWLYVFLFLGFLVKLPIYLFHLWLPEAHVQAPVEGSMILAGVLLKLGGIMLLYFILCFLGSAKGIVFLVVGLTLVGGAICRVICIGRPDMKVVVAYSSVYHISVVLAILFLRTFSTLHVGLMIIVSHGFCSSGMFMFLNYIYIGSRSRRVFLNKGGSSVIPKFIGVWAILVVCNIGGPVGVSLLLEGISVRALSISYGLFICFVALGFMVRLFFNIGLYNAIFHGKVLGAVLPKSRSY